MFFNRSELAATITMPTSSIVVLGGPAAGKTVFLTVLYQHLWNGHGDLAIRASTGSMHSELLAAGEQLLSGTLPAATQALRHYEFELRKGEREYDLRFLDYPGELFRKVFYDALVDSDEARELYDVSTSADGVIALVDPKSIHDGTWDIDYALSNLLRFYRSNGRKHPHFVLAFTKRDETEKVVGDSASSFLKDHLPHLAAELGDSLRLQHFCSIRIRNGNITLAQPETVTAPLRAVIDAMETEHVVQTRRAYVRRLSWQRTFTRCAAVLLIAALLVVAFSTGVICRAKPDGGSSLNPPRETTL